MGKEFEKEQIHVHTTELTAATLKHRVPEGCWATLHSGCTGKAGPLSRGSPRGRGLGQGKAGPLPRGGLRGRGLGEGPTEAPGTPRASQ